MSNNGDGTWGHLSSTEHFARNTTTCDYSTIEYQETSSATYAQHVHAGHCMIYSKYSEKVFDLYNPRAAVMMQMRFDGYVGFPGGLIDEGESVLSGLNRELVEELNLDVARIPVKQDHHVVSHLNENQKLLLHFFAVEVPFNTFKEIEKNALSAHEYGIEVLGVIRVPLYTMGDGFRGFPAFLTNTFVGNSRQQLLYSLQHLQIMTAEEIKKARSAKPV